MFAKVVLLFALVACAYSQVLLNNGLVAPGYYGSGLLAPGITYSNGIYGSPLTYGSGIVSPLTYGSGIVSPLGLRSAGLLAAPGLLWKK